MKRFLIGMCIVFSLLLLIFGGFKFGPLLASFQWGWIGFLLWSGSLCSRLKK